MNLQACIRMAIFLGMTLVFCTSVDTSFGSQAPSLPLGNNYGEKTVDGIEVIWIPSGTFTMGDNDGSEASPEHKVNISGFWIGKYEITQEQWVKYMGTNPSKHALSPKHPVESVLYSEIETFLLNFGKQNKVHARLPTESEWEYAARGGVKESWYWGDDAYQMYKYANYADRSFNSKDPETNAYDDGFTYTAPVGSFLPNGYGLYDMLGNIDEATMDVQKSYYPRIEQTNPLNTEGSNFNRRSRGGSYFTRLSWVHLDSRGRFPNHPKVRLYDQGFRIVIEEPGVSAKYTHLVGKVLGTPN